MNRTPIGAIACFAAACVVTAFAAAHAQTPEPERPRDALIRALEALIATGEPGHTNHDAGEWLQRAIDGAIGRGDAEIEKLAIRAASPLTARISRPVSSTDHLPSLEVNALTVLKLVRPMTYSARVLVSIDGTDFVQMPEQLSGKRGGFRIDRLGLLAAQPGFHDARVRAHLTFGDPGQPAWTEVRDLPRVFYAIYDVQRPTPADARSLVYGPAAVTVRDLDPQLGDEPFALWLAGVLAKHRSPLDSGPDWASQYCSERTAEAGTRPIPTAICAVVHFGVGDSYGQIWFRTADTRVTADGVEWVRTSPPRFEGLVIRSAAPESQRLSTLPLLLETHPTLRPTGDVAIAPDDIVITPRTPKPGAPAAVTVTVRNQGQGDLHKVAVHVAFGSSLTVRVPSRQYVVDLPAESSVEIRLDVVFPEGFGFLLVHAMQIGEHAPPEFWTPDPTLDDACAFRIVNPGAAPPRYVELLREMSSCRGQ